MQEKGVRVVFETYSLSDPNNTLARSTVMNDVLKKPTNCLDFSMAHEQQITLLQSIQDCLITEKTALINQNTQVCPSCSGLLKKRGKQHSSFHDVFTDHQVHIQRLKCEDCGYEAPATVRTLLNSSLSGALTKIQSELGASQTFRDSEHLFKTFCAKTRSINNHNRIKQVTHRVGGTINAVDRAEQYLLEQEEAKELVINIDGGHIKTTEAQRSIEALTSVVYRPGSLLSNDKRTRNYLSSKNCAASVKEDNQKEIITNTIIAAMKQGLTPNTHITALCDGAANCWNVVEGLRSFCGRITSILDWFHIAMKMQNISLPEKAKRRFLRIKWHLWRGNVEASIHRLDALISEKDLSKSSDKLRKFKVYIQNNKDRIVDYRKRQKAGLVFTSNLAESTVESLINQRCKGQQHMRWSREGLEPILQLRAKLHTSDWENKWKTVVLHSLL